MIGREKELSRNWEEKCVLRPNWKRDGIQHRVANGMKLVGTFLLALQVRYRRDAAGAGLARELLIAYLR
jgi:hypothetical protein